ncbi:MAG: putative sulfate exporter family transporter [Bacteroidaceae bacterium]|nr:putative sulfate exporter family transporter [Bacteroidaceae bacterium]
MVNKIVYVGLVAVMGLSLLLGFGCEVFGLSLGDFAWLTTWVKSWVALALGIVFALVFGTTFPDFNKLMSKKLLQYSVIGLGFGMNLNAALASGREGMLFTIVSVFGTLALGWLVGRKLLKVDTQTSYLISAGTAICGGSAIAAVGPVIKAKAESMSVALGVVFILNAVALFVFPYVGDVLGMTLKQFGMWAAIAIHDTSSVVGAGRAFDEMHPDWVAAGTSALEIATTIKLTRALWIVVIALVTPFFFRSLKSDGQQRPWYKAIPAFIIWFIVAILFNTYVLSHSELGTEIGSGINKLAKHLITLSLFFIGASLTRDTLRAVGIRPLVQGVILWVLISGVSLAYIFLVG